jgi:hypothetical protein
MTTTLVKLLEQKQQLIELLQGDPGPEERDEIERLLEKIDTALNLLDEAGPGAGDWSAMPRAPYIHEKFAKDRQAARKLAQEYFERYPKDRRIATLRAIHRNEGCSSQIASK